MGKNGRKIQLFKNFRSRKEVLDFTNLIFENIMGEKLGDIDYNEEEYLNLGAVYENNGQELLPEIDILDTNVVKDLRYKCAGNQKFPVRMTTHSKPPVPVIQLNQMMKYLKILNLRQNLYQTK